MLDSNGVSPGLNQIQLNASVRPATNHRKLPENVRIKFCISPRATILYSAAAETTMLRCDIRTNSRANMRDQFRTDVSKQLVREAKIGLSVVSVLLALFLYVAFYKISGRGRHLPDHVRNAPIGESDWSDTSPVFNSTTSSPTDLEFGPERIAMTPSNPAPADRDSPESNPALQRKSFLPTSGNQLDKLGAAGLNSKRSMTNEETSKTIQERRDSTRLAGRDETSVSSFLGPFAANKTPKITVDNPGFVPSEKTASSETENAALRTQFESPTARADEPKLSAKTSNESFSPEPGSLAVNDLRAGGSKVQQIQSSVAVLNETKPEIHLTSAETKETEATSENDFVQHENFDVDDDDPSALRPALSNSSESNQGKSLDPTEDASTDGFEPTDRKDNSFRADLPTESTSSTKNLDVQTADTSWNGNSQKMFPTISSASEFGAAKNHVTKPPHPEQHVVQGQTKRLPRPSQEDIARSILVDESSPFLQTNRLPNALPVNKIPNSVTYTTEEGDSYWSIAVEIYQDGRFFRALYEHNKPVAPSFELEPGIRLSTPAKSDLVKLWPDKCPREESDRADGVNGLETESGKQVYVTEQGDTLFEIAGQKLGQASRYLEIYHLNRDRLNSNVNSLSPLSAGLRLVLPAQ